MIFSYFSQLIVWLYQFTGSFGVSIVLFTIALRLALLPFSLSSLKATKKMMAINPKLKELKKKHGNNNQALQQAQLALYKEHGVNPAAGCLPQVVQLIVLIFLYQAFIHLLRLNEGGVVVVNGVSINSWFIWTDLTKPDTYHVWPILAGVSQLFLSLMMLTKDAFKTTPADPKKKDKKDDQPDATDTAMNMQKQMVLIMPIITGFIGWGLPAGLSLYWTVTTLVSIIQQWYVSGWGWFEVLKDVPIFHKQSKK